jgi:nucleotide-binding universal stress UspA family protein
MTRLKAAIPEEARTWCKPEERVASGKAYREILRVAAETNAELIVMGVHGRGAIDRWLFGSTTHHVLRETTCPALTLRA